MGCGLGSPLARALDESARATAYTTGQAWCITEAIDYALGQDSDGIMPGVIVPTNDPYAIADALRAWCADAELRYTLRTAALGRGSALEEWDVAARRLTDVLSRLASEPRIVA